MDAMMTGDERVARMQSLLPSPKSFDNTIHLSPDLGFMFFSNPIVACSSLKATLNRATARALGLPVPELRMGAIHDRDANPLQRPSDIGLTRFAEMLDDPAVRKIAFVRDPLGRFMSCFGKKLSRENRITERVRAHMKVPSTVALGDFLTPHSFAAALEADPALLNMNDHWRPQRRQVFYDLVPDLQIGRVEAFQADVDRLLAPIFGAGGYEVIDVPALFPQNSSRSRGAAVPALSDAGREAVRRVYAGDIEMLAEVEAAADNTAPRRVAKASKSAARRKTGADKVTVAPKVYISPLEALSARVDEQAARITALEQQLAAMQKAPSRRRSKT